MTRQPSNLAREWRLPPGRLASDRVKVAIAVSDRALCRLDDVLTACRARGFEPDAALSGVGILVGSAPLAQLGRLRRVPGVAAVERRRPAPAQPAARLDS